MTNEIGLKKGTLYVLIGMAVSMLSVYGLHLVVARHLSIEQYGSFGVFLAILVILDKILATGIAVSITTTLTTSKIKISNVIKDAFFAILSFISFVIVGAYALKPFLYELLNYNDIMFDAIVASIILLGLLGFFRGISQRLKHMQYFGLSQITENLPKLLLTLLALMAFNSDVSGISIAIVFAIAFSVIVYIIMYRHMLMDALSATYSYSNIKKIYALMLTASASNTLGYLFISSGPILVKMLSANDGYFLAALITATSTLTNIPVLIMSAFYTNLLPKLNDAYHSKGKEYIKELTKGISYLIIILVLAYVTILSIYGPTILKILFGDAFIVHHIHFTILASVSAFYILNFLYFQYHIIIHSLKIIFISRVTSVVVLIVYLASPIQLHPLVKVETGLLIAIITGFLILHYSFLRSRAI